MTRLIFHLFLILWGAQVSAQALSVKSGEHAGFTRFVVRLVPGDNWALSTGQRRVTLTVENAQAQFDLSSAFDRIPRGRVKDVSQEEIGAPLQFELDCDCEVDSFVTKQNWLVIDFSDHQSVDKQVAALLLPTPEFRFALDEGFEPFSPRVEREEQQSDNGLRVEGFSLPLVPENPLTTVDLNLSPPVSAKTPDEGAQNYEDRLVDQIERAVDQGLLVGKPSEATVSSQVDDQSANEAIGLEGLQTQLQSNVVVATAIDRDLEQVAESLRALAPTASNCILPSYVALHKWGDGRPFADQISTKRLRLVDDLTQVDAMAVLDLAKTYLYFGFGAEALHALETLSEGSEVSFALESLARLVDTLEPLQTNPFSGQQHCDSDVAMWAVLAEPVGTSDANVPAVLQAVARLPEGVRFHMAPALSRLFSNIGDVETAEAILRTLDRTAAEPNPAAHLAAASAAELRGDVEQANDLRINVAASNSELTPEALVQLVDSRFELRQGITPDVIDLVGAYVDELERSNLLIPLQKAEVTALSMAGRFDEAVERLGKIDTQQHAGSANVATLNVLQMLTEIGNDMDFLRHALNLSEGIEERIPEELGNALAERLLRLGFAQPALRVLSAVDAQGTGSQRRLLRAEAALAEYLPHEAMIALLGLEGQAASELRATAMSQKQDYAQAAALLLEAGDTVGLPRIQWLAEDWQEGETDGQKSRYEEVSGIAARLRASNLGVQQDETLENARTLLGSSLRARTDIDQLLTKLEIRDEDLPSEVR